MPEEKIDNMTEYLRAYLVSNYGVPEYVADRYTNILVGRAIRSYINKGLDSLTIEEDLYQEDDDGNEFTEISENGNFVNLEVCEEAEKDYIETNTKNLN